MTYFFFRVYGGDDWLKKKPVETTDRCRRSVKKTINFFRLKNYGFTNDFNTYTYKILNK